MKRLSLLFLLTFFTIGIYAQGDHLRFMGIPLNGTITQFQDKLLGKGVALDREMNKILPEGSRAFKGTFSGNYADIVVFYDIKTRIVYRAKAIITCKGKKAAENKFYQYKEMLSIKYPDAETHSGTSEGYVAFRFDIPSVSEGNLGFIELFLSDDELNYNDVSLHIDYKDNINSTNHKKQNLDDL